MSFWQNLALIGILCLALPSLAKEETHICYFSLNNEKEFKVMKSFTDKLNKVSKKSKITVSEFLTEGEDPEDSFKKMIESGKKCDGLVISGHHTGSFGGKRSHGSLKVGFLEKMSCDPKYKDWFSHIKALWLQGCRTLGVEKIEAIDSADFHTDRVGAVLNEDHLTQSFADLNMEFSATLDQDNPLSSRYLRVFPRASVFGWTKTAPGEKVKSEHSIPFHIANMTKHMDDRKKHFENPIGTLSPKSAVKYMNATLKLLKSDPKTANACGVTQAATQGWIDHGHREKNKYAFYNPNLNAYSPLAITENGTLKKAKTLDCLLKNSKDKNAILGAVSEIIKDEALIGYSFNSLWEIMKRYEKQNNTFDLIELEEKLKRSPILMNFVMRKLESKELGLIRKIDYYSFYKDLTKTNYPKINQAILVNAKKIILKDSKGNYNLRDYQETLAYSLAKNGLANQSFVRSIIDSNEAHRVALRLALSIIKNSETKIEGASEILKKMIDPDKNNELSDLTLGYAISTIKDSNHEIKDTSEILNKIIDSEKADYHILAIASEAIGDSKYEIKNAGEILKKIIDSKKNNRSSLEHVPAAIKNSKYEIKDAGEILKTIIDHQNSDRFALGYVAGAIGGSKYKIKDAGEILKTIIDHKNSNRFALEYVAWAIGNSKYEIKDAAKILKKVIDSKKGNGFTLKYVAGAIGGSKYKIKDAGEILKTIIDHKNSNKFTLKYVAWAIGDSKYEIKDAAEILKKIIDSKKSSRNTLKKVSRAIQSMKIQGKQKLLKQIEKRLKTIK